MPDVAWSGGLFLGGRRYGGGEGMTDIESWVYGDSDTDEIPPFEDSDDEGRPVIEEVVGWDNPGLEGPSSEEGALDEREEFRRILAEHTESESEGLDPDPPSSTGYPSSEEEDGAVVARAGTPFSSDMDDGNDGDNEAEGGEEGGDKDEGGEDGGGEDEGGEEGGDGDDGGEGGGEGEDEDRDSSARRALGAPTEIAIEGARLQLLWGEMVYSGRSGTGALRAGLRFTAFERDALLEAERAGEGERVWRILGDHMSVFTLLVAVPLLDPRQPTRIENGWELCIVFDDEEFPGVELMWHGTTNEGLPVWWAEDLEQRRVYVYNCALAWCWARLALDNGTADLFSFLLDTMVVEYRNACGFGWGATQIDFGTRVPDGMMVVSVHPVG